MKKASQKDNMSLFDVFFCPLSPGFLAFVKPRVKIAKPVVNLYRPQGIKPCLLSYLRVKGS
jgi:hypothetical protein